MKKKYGIIAAVAVCCMLLIGGCAGNNNAAVGVNEGKDQVAQTGSESGEATGNEGQKESENAGPEQNIVYISASKLNVRQEPVSGATVLAKAPKGSRVQILEEKTDESGKLWYKINFKDVSGDVAGWIAAEYTVEKLEDLLTGNLKNLDLSPFEKAIEYEGNPKVKVKGVYVTIHSAAGANLEKLIQLAENTEINAFVVDVKDDLGNMLFKSQTAEKYAPDANNKAPIKDVKAFTQKLKEKNIYLIARIVSFKDPTYSKYHPERSIQDKSTGQTFVGSDGLKWVSAYDRELWDYNIGVAKEAADAGFNEIQFDYVRFPASNGGRLDSKLDYRNTNNEFKPEAIQKYLKYAHEQLSPKKVYISADVFGLVGSVSDDMGLGQHWEAVSNVTDYICPMMYPSHYGAGVYGLAVPDAKPYETVYKSTYDSVVRNSNLQTPATIRPWIQDFTATWVKGNIRYGTNEVNLQIKALNDNGVDEYLLWNAGNRYSIK